VGEGVAVGEDLDGIVRERAFILGGTDADNMGDEPLTWDVPAQGSYCPVEGQAAAESHIVLDSYVIDLDRFLVSPRDLFDPVEVAVVDASFTGTLTVEMTGADTGTPGDYTACFAASGEATIQPTKNLVRQAMAEHCSGENIDCDDLLALIDQHLPETITVTVEETELCRVAEESLRAQHDASFCL